MPVGRRVEAHGEEAERGPFFLDPLDDADQSAMLRATGEAVELGDDHHVAATQDAEQSLNVGASGDARYLLGEFDLPEQFGIAFAARQVAAAKRVRLEAVLSQGGSTMKHAIIRCPHTGR